MQSKLGTKISSKTSEQGATFQTNPGGNQVQEQPQLGQIIKVVNETQFLKMMGERAASRQWRALECIQSTIKASKGLGNHIPIKFTMQLDYNEQREMKKEVLEGQTQFAGAKTLGLKYDYQAIGEDFRKEILNESKSSIKK